MANYIVGLTGGIGSGKTTVANMFSRFNIDLVDADLVARQVVEPNSTCLNEIVKHLGSDILLEDKTLNRAQLRELVFNDAELKLWLNNLLHPAIRTEMLRQLNDSTSSYTLLIAPLLFENGLEQHCNTTIAIDVPEAIQLSRTVQRDNNSESIVKNIIQSQISREKRLSKADIIIDNNQPLTKVESIVLEIHHTILEQSIT